MSGNVNAVKIGSCMMDNANRARLAVGDDEPPCTPRRARHEVVRS